MDVGFPFLIDTETIKLDADDSFLKHVEGELYSLTSLLTLRGLDSLESEGSMYHRKIIKTQAGVETWAYICAGLARDTYTCCTINENGDWQWP